MQHRLIVERNVSVPMRDGVCLEADVWRPDVSERVPAVLARTPYDRADIHQLAAENIDIFRLVEDGFAMVWQDTRGRFGSAGRFRPFFDEASDGYDSVEWLAGQPWCSGDVGMTCSSYLGVTEWLAAVAQPPHLKAIFPHLTASEYFEGWTYQGGAFQLGFALFWALYLAPDTARRLATTGESSAEEHAALLEALGDSDPHYRHLPLRTLPILRRSRAATYYFDWLAHSSLDEYWQPVAVNRRYGQIRVPAFNVGGWYDIFLHGTLENYTRMRQKGSTPEARAGQRLLIGPWGHGDQSGVFAEVSFGPQSSLASQDLTGLNLAFFRQHLKGMPASLDPSHPVRIFVMGENRWHDEQDWPLPSTRYTPWYLHSEGAAGGPGGTISPQSPSAEPPDTYIYDPNNPVPTLGGAVLIAGSRMGSGPGPCDQRKVETRPDVLVYTSAPLDHSLEVTGPLVAVLYAGTSAPDTDFVVRLCDVNPDGASRILAEGVQRARFRAGNEAPSLIEPGAVNEYRIDLVATSNAFLAGHSIRVDVTSSSFPRFDANPNTGHPLGEDGPEDVRVARQTIFHDGARPSYILLPVVDRSGAISSMDQPGM
jgi:uncharacterized protein